MHNKTRKERKVKSKTAIKKRKGYINTLEIVLVNLEKRGTFEECDILAFNNWGSIPLNWNRPTTGMSSLFHTWTILSIVHN